MSKSNGFTIVELLIVIVVIAILASISVVAFNGVQARAKDASRTAKLNQIADAIELYKLDNGRYPAIQHGRGDETSCGSQTDSWGHCDRLKQLTDLLVNYATFDPTQLSSGTQGNYYYSYSSQADDGYQSYGLMVYLQGNEGQNDGGYYSNALEVGSNPRYCTSTYTGSDASWLEKYSGLYARRCSGGN